MIMNFGMQRLDKLPIPQNKDEIRCFIVVRNGEWRIPYFLYHYRSIGINRFFFIDNMSEDDTREVLLKQPDVHLWVTSNQYCKSNYGMDWLHKLLQSYGEGYWCIVVDIDELLIFTNYENDSLNNFIVKMKNKKIYAGKGVVLDMYSNKKIKDTTYDVGSSYLDSCNYFEFPFIRHKLAKVINRIVRLDKYPRLDPFTGKGTVRHRVFGVSAYIRKYPIFLFGKNITLSPGCHRINGLDKLDSRFYFGLLHFKYFSDFLSSVVQEAKREQHWMGAVEYKQYARCVNEELNLHSKRSIQYINSIQLEEIGILANL